jgi:hypothetical protein
MTGTPTADNNDPYGVPYGDDVRVVRVETVTRTQYVLTRIISVVSDITAMVVVGSLALLALYYATGPGPINRDSVLRIALTAGGISFGLLVLAVGSGELRRWLRYRRYFRNLSRNGRTDGNW